MAADGKYWFPAKRRGWGGAYRTRGKAGSSSPSLAASCLPAH